MTTAWIDIRNCKPDEIAEIVGAAKEHRIEAVISNGHADEKLRARQAGLQWVSMENESSGVHSDKVEADVHVHSRRERLTSDLRHSKKDGILIDIENSDTLAEACAAVRAGLLTVVRFRDPTKIPLEIVLAAGSRRGAKIMTFVSDLAEARVVMSVLESGPDGVIMAPRTAAEVEALGRLCSPARAQIELKEFTVTEIADAGTGDRVCVDTCSNFFPDEGLLVGSFGGAFLLCCSENSPAAVHADQTIPGQRRRGELVHSFDPRSDQLFERTMPGRHGNRGQGERRHPSFGGRSRQDRNPAAAFAQGAKRG